jgi:hypothetical protein
MSIHLIAEIAAGLGVLGSVVYAVFWILSIRALREIRDELRKRR